jgi:hypothetical protein
MGTLPSGQCVTVGIVGCGNVMDGASPGRVDFYPIARQGPWSAPWVSALGQTGHCPLPLHTTTEKKCAGIPRWVYCVGLLGANIRVQNKGGGNHDQ